MYYYSPTLNESYDNELKIQDQCKKLNYNKFECVQNTEQNLTILPADSIPIDIHKATFICNRVNFYSKTKQIICSSFK